MCVCVCVYGYVHISADTLRIHKRASDALELRVTDICSCLPLVLETELSCQNSKCSSPGSQLSRQPLIVR